MLRVNMEGVEYLPTLSTHSLEAVEVPEGVVKEWKRRKGAAAAIAEHAHQLELAGVFVETPNNVDPPRTCASRGSPAAQTVSRLGPHLRRIRKMAPSDEHGMWLLKNLLTQTAVEDQEELCHSIQDKLSKRKFALTRSKDRLKLECDRRYVFTKAVNEIRTSSELTCEMNRGNVLSTIVKDHLHARRQMEKKNRQKQFLGQTNSAAEGFPDPPSSSRGRRGPKERIGARETERSRGQAGAGAKIRGGSQAHSQEVEPVPSLLPPPLVLSATMAKMPISPVIVATSPPQPDRGNFGVGGSVKAPPAAVAVAATAAVPANVSRKRRQRARNVPSVRHRGRVQKINPLAGHPRLPRSSSVQAKNAPAPAGVGTFGAGGSTVWGVRRLGLPPLEERYPNVKDSWVHLPVELRLQRPRCKSVDVAHLDQPGYKAYMARVLRAGAAATRQGRQESVGADMDSQERRGTGCAYGRGTRLRSSLTKSKQRGRTPGPSLRVSSSCLSVQEEELQANGGGGVDGDGGGGSSHGRNGRREESLSVQTTPLPMHTLSRFQLRDGEKGVFRLTSCDAEEDPRPTANGGGRGSSPAKMRRETFPQRSTFGAGREDNSSAASTTDDVLASESLRLRSKTARMVFKQTQRLLGALQTPAISSKTTSTGSRRGCGGGTVGGHPGVVVHHRGAASDGGDSGGDVRSGPGLGCVPGRDDEVWRSARGTRPARLAEVFRCVVPPHTVRIECDILLHETLSRAGNGGRVGDGVAGGGHNGTWDDFVWAWECLGDGILAGRALSNLWEHEQHVHGGNNDASRSERAADDLLSDGLRRALLATHTYRPPVADQLFVEWLDELLEVVRVHVRRACSRVPLQHGLTTGLGWFKEVCNDQRFLGPATTHRDF